MQKKIYKYELELVDSQKLSLPATAEPLCVQIQYNRPMLWAIVPIEEKEFRDFTIRICGTGHPCDDVSRSTYVGTFQMNNGQLVFHVFAEAN